MPTIYINNQPYEVEPEQNLLHACLSLGFDIPYFCWHPALHSVGACRMCAVKQFKDENDTKGRIVMSCMTLAADGVRISIDDPEVLAFRKNVIEWLMLNHPHDCPVCDEGGECHLQDMTVLVGHTYRRSRFKKRTYRNQDLGPFIRHEMNRCIQCYRCIRFYHEYACARDLDVFGWHNRVYFGKNKDGVLKSEFSGNLVEICPTGVFTDKTFYRHFTRKWDLQSAPSVCTHCGLGCNIHADERYGMLRRIRNRFHSQVNGYFICDRGRFGYEFVNSDNRIRRARMRDANGTLTVLSPNAALDRVRMSLNHKTVIGIGSSRASLESNYALQQLVGSENFYAGTSAVEKGMVNKVIDTLSRRAVKTATLQEVGQADAVVILGEDVLNFAPMLGLAVRRAILQKPSAIIKDLHIEPWDDAAVREALQQENGPLYIAAPQHTGLDDNATSVYHSAPADLARLGFAVAHQLDKEAPAVDGLPKEVRDLVQRIAADLAEAKRPCIIAGTSLADRTLIEAAANMAQALYNKNENTRICFTVPACNSMGLGLLGGASLDAAIMRAQQGHLDTLLILENDLFRHLNTTQAGKLLDLADTVIAMDAIETPTTDKADLVLPVAPFAESSGTFINNEGRAQRFYRAYVPAPEIRESWKWIHSMWTCQDRDNPVPWPNLDALIQEISRHVPACAAIAEAAPSADFRRVAKKIPRQSHRYSGRTALHAHINMHESPPPQDKDAALAFSMEGYPGQAPGALITHYWAPYWNSVQAVNKYQEQIGGPLRGQDAGKRLIEPVPGTQKIYFDEIPDAYKAKDHMFLVVPAYHIFGSEELSSWAPGIRALHNGPYIAVNPEQVTALDINDDGTVEVAFSNISYYLPVRVNPWIPRGLALVPMGFSGFPWDGLPFWFRPPRTPNPGGQRPESQ